jgi:hypothetical protein
MIAQLPLFADEHESGSLTAHEYYEQFAEAELRLIRQELWFSDLGLDEIYYQLGVINEIVERRRNSYMQERESDGKASAR